MIQQDIGQVAIERQGRYAHSYTRCMICPPHCNIKGVVVCGFSNSGHPETISIAKHSELSTMHSNTAVTRLVKVSSRGAKDSE